MDTAARAGPAHLDEAWDVLEDNRHASYYMLVLTLYIFSVYRCNNIPLCIYYYIITMIGDRLDNLANQFYGDSTLYWVLQIANEDCKKDSLYPPIGIQLRIPQNITKILQDFEKING